MRRILITVTLVAGALAPATGVLARQTPQPAENLGVRLLDAPANRRDDPRARVYIVDHLPPAATIRRRIEVSNNTANRATIQVYAAAAEVNDGAFRFADDRASNELTEWTKLDRSSLDLAANSAGIINLTVAVPSDAAPGERYGVVWAELPPSSPPPGGGISVVSRVGIRMYVSVGAGAEPASDFVIDTVTAARDAAGAPVVNTGVTNTGGRALDLSGELTLTDGPGGLSKRPVPVKVGTTLGLGESAPVTVTLEPDLPAGPWTASVTLRSGRVERTARGTITFPLGNGVTGSPVPVVPVAKDSGLSPVVVGALAALGALVVALLLLLLLWRRRRKNPPPQSLDELLEALRQADLATAGPLLDAAASYGQAALLAHPKLPLLPVDIARALGERVAGGGKRARR